MLTVECLIYAINFTSDSIGRSLKLWGTSRRLRFAETESFHNKKPTSLFTQHEFSYSCAYQ
ncbi:dubious [Schizosaccharomyces pombe]|uniref:Putative uncharacterized protein C3E7.17 n=1 Tax=Schizosaccharomyces pombe (strain 972 / ATCC 24843) TaxID=284812 RepID=YHXH_SCHPO|nr:uncharacterized protein SPBC3E7.17 [Schizosaccharomyces pombe]G2TRQ5.1 RecName: Full=Putative uncharacterized protein C3E7.17 [Schizosaccharomyces pombe 972h-]CCD31372.1 dubious [Schizosaccharomyces pombe]|eukprot:NP_001343162.1 uncharacterized protein SPBC3E7.17 [Schizosaccharomyces pombe]